MTQETEQKLVPVEPTDDMLEAGYPLLDAVQPLASIYRAMVAAAPPAPSGWRSMESAPRDGRRILIWSDLFNPGGPVVVRWDEDRYAKKPLPRWMTHDPAYGARGFITNPPTHWMPLPEAPGSAAPSPDTGKMGGEDDWIDQIAEAVHIGRFPADRTPTAFADEDQSGRDYCYRIARSVAALSAPVSVGDGEAVAWQRLGTNGWVSVDPEDISHYREKGQKIRALGVIHPSDPDATERMRARIGGWADRIDCLAYAVNEGAFDIIVKEMRAALGEA